MATVKQLRVSQVWEHRMRYAKGRTAKDAKVRWKRLEKFFANMLAQRVTPELIMQYRAQRATQPHRGKPVATINRELEARRHAYKPAQQDRLLAVVPHIDIEHEDNVRTGFVPDAKQDELRREAKDLWLRTMLELGLSYGWRKEELLSLTVGQVDFGVNVIRLEVGTTKNDKAREVPMLPAVRQLLTQCCTGRKAAQRVLTFSSGSSKGQTVRHPRVAWEHLCVRCGLGHYESRTVGCGQQIAQLGSAKCKPKERCKECRTFGALPFVRCATLAFPRSWP